MLSIGSASPDSFPSVVVVSTVSLFVAGPACSDGLRLMPFSALPFPLERLAPAAVRAPPLFVLAASVGLILRGAAGDDDSAHATVAASRANAPTAAVRVHRTLFMLGPFQTMVF